MNMKRALVAIALLAAQTASGLIIKMERNKEKCSTEQGRKGTAFSGSFSAVYSDTFEPVPSRRNNPNSPEHAFTFKILDPHSLELFKADDSAGTFYFMPEADGPISLCFTDHGSRSDREYSISLTHHHGTTTEEYKEIAKREELYPIAAELRRLEDDVWSIKDEMTYQKKREEDLRDLNESVNEKAAWLPVYAIIVLGISGVLQGYFLKQFFIKKKLI